MPPKPAPSAPPSPAPVVPAKRKANVMESRSKRARVDDATEPEASFTEPDKSAATSDAEESSPEEEEDQADGKTAASLESEEEAIASVAAAVRRQRLQRSNDTSRLIAAPPSIREEPVDLFEYPFDSFLDLPLALPPQITYAKTGLERFYVHRPLGAAQVVALYPPGDRPRLPDSDPEHYSLDLWWQTASAWFVEGARFNLSRIVASYNKVVVTERAYFYSFPEAFHPDEPDDEDVPSMLRSAPAAPDFQPRSMPPPSFDPAASTEDLNAVFAKHTLATAQFYAKENERIAALKLAHQVAVEKWHHDVQEWRAQLPLDHAEVCKAVDGYNRARVRGAKMIERWKNSLGEATYYFAHTVLTAAPSSARAPLSPSKIASLRSDDEQPPSSKSAGKRRAVSVEVIEDEEDTRARTRMRRDSSASMGGGAEQGGDGLSDADFVRAQKLKDLERGREAKRSERVAKDKAKAAAKEATPKPSKSRKSNKSADSAAPASAPNTYKPELWHRQHDYATSFSSRDRKHESFNMHGWESSRNSSVSPKAVAGLENFGIIGPMLPYVTYFTRGMVRPRFPRIPFPLLNAFPQGCEACFLAGSECVRGHYGDRAPTSYCARCRYNQKSTLR